MHERVGGLLLVGRWVIASGLVVLTALFGWIVQVHSTRNASVAFVDGRILTMDATDSVSEAMLVRDGEITALGSSADIRALAGDDIAIVELDGRVAMPGIVDAHSHFPVSGLAAVSIDLAAPPLGDIGTQQALLDRLALSHRNTAAGEWLLGFNYDNTSFPDGRHPTREMLDAIAADRPVYLWHSSGHMGVANSMALQALGFDESSSGISGGMIGRDLATGRLNGLLQEKAAPSLARLLRELPWRRLLSVIFDARDEYLSAGVTTVQNGHGNLLLARALKWARRLGILRQRVVFWASHTQSGRDMLAGRFDGLHDPEGFFLPGVKMVADGSPQGLTAWLSEPYDAAARLPDGYAGFPAMPIDELHAAILEYHQAGRQLALHGNGDAAIEAIIDGVEAAQQSSMRTDARHVLIHAQTVRRDQMMRLPALPLTPSFFTTHTWYWGDWHRLRGLGEARVHAISPAGWAEEFGVRYTLHSDAPVTPIETMQMVWSASERLTASGVRLGVEQRISRRQALRAITIDSAWQNGIENKVGSLEPGKRGDVIILSADPEQIDDVRDVVVLETWIDGVRRFARN